MKIDTTFLQRCIQALQRAIQQLEIHTPDTIEYEMFRSAAIKEFEIILEQSGKLLRHCLKPWFASAKAVDRLTFKEVFRYAAKHDLIDLESSERWLIYRDNRNNTAHDYGVNFAEATLKLLPQFIADASALEQTLRRCDYD